MVRDGNTQSGLAGLTTLFPRRATRRSTSTVDRSRPKTSTSRSAASSTRCRPTSAPLRQPLQQVRPHLQGLRPGRQPLPARARRHPPALRAQHRRARWSRSGTLADVKLQTAARDDHALQPLPRRHHQRHGRAGLQLGPGARDHGSTWPSQKLPATWDTSGRRMSYQEKLVGNQAIYIFALASSWSTSSWPPSTRAGPPGGRHPGRAAGPAGHRAGADRAALRQQHLHPDRPRAAHRARRQERDPHRRVWPRAAGRRHGRSWRPRSRPPSCGSGRSS